MSEIASGGKATAPPVSPDGAHTLLEILSQPSCWSTSLQQLQENGGLKTLAPQFSDTHTWIFIGCGSSFYVAQSAAATMTALTGRRAKAVPASEPMLFPELVLSAERACVPVLISRSGHTSEVLKVAEFLRERGIATLGISCAPGQALETLVSSTMIFPTADEQSMVMTRSFTSMLMALQARPPRLPAMRNAWRLNAGFPKPLNSCCLPCRAACTTSPLLILSRTTSAWDKVPFMALRARWA